ncbi:DUF3566 domain-containing protein [Agrococcus jejuensis]|uniref:DUF3566 domain-containing protein n=1 Tax=Agrococcus jejuensis TaxID=399736 RepID=UPI0011A003B6|nr:DUF3566 domain-containing protein [Agrococcus jejuensis]
MSIAERLQGKGPRRSGGKQVRLRLVWIDFWSALKLSAIVGVIAGIVLIVVSFVLWTLLNLLGLFGRIDDTLSDILGDSFTVMSFLSLPQVLLFSVIVALLNFVVITVLGAVFATLYNLSVRFTGGLLVGFSNQ